jgi:hypothetical protein
MLTTFAVPVTVSSPIVPDGGAGGVVAAAGAGATGSGWGVGFLAAQPASAPAQNRIPIVLSVISILQFRLTSAKPQYAIGASQVKTSTEFQSISGVRFARLAISRLEGGGRRRSIIMTNARIPRTAITPATTAAEVISDVAVLMDPWERPQS